MATEPSSYFSEMTTRVEIDKILRKGQGFTCKDMPDHVTERYGPFGNTSIRRGKKTPFVPYS